MSQPQPKLYTELAGWWQIFSPTSDYANEGGFFSKLFKKAGAKSILELGAGGGNIAYYLKEYFAMTLTDISSGMLEMSKKQNPACQHIVGDMRSLRIGKTYDGVFIHDAVMYMTAEEDLKAVLETAYAHCKPGGTVVIAPDCVKETFKPGTIYEGHDEGERSVRYIQWISDDETSDTVFNYDFVIALKEKGDLRTVVDRQLCGVFPRQTWLNLMAETGFTAKAIVDSSTKGEDYERTEVFVGKKN